MKISHDHALVPEILKINVGERIANPTNTDALVPISTGTSDMDGVKETPRVIQAKAVRRVLLDLASSARGILYLSIHSALGEIYYPWGAEE